MEGFESDSTFFFVRLNKCNMTRLISQTWQCDPALSHIFAGAVRIAGFTWLVALQEEELARAFVGVDLCGQRRGIGKLQRHMTFPRSEEHTSELQSLMRISYAVFCLKKKKIKKEINQ